MTSLTDSPSNATGKNIQVLERTRLILDILAKNPSPLSLQALSKQAGLHPSTTHRIIWGLAASGFVERSEHDWQLGIRFLDYGTRYLERQSFVNLAQPFLASLTTDTGQDAILALRDGDHSVVIGQAGCGNGKCLIGQRKALHHCSSGKIFLSQMPADELSAFLSQLRGSKASIPSESLFVEIQQIRERGWAEHTPNDQEGMRTLAVGLNTMDDARQKALVLSTKVENAVAPSWIEALRECGARLSELLVQHTIR